MKIKFREKKIQINQTDIVLNNYEFKTLYYLASHPNWVFTKEQIYEAVWNESGEFCGSAVANVISQIRRKLRQAGVKREYIQTVVNSGYRFVKEDN